MKKVLFSLLVLVMVVTITGCGKSKYPELKEDAQSFLLGEYIDHNDDDFSYGTIDYSGRTYMAYGNLKGNLNEKELEECIGYVVLDTNSDSGDTSSRIYTLTKSKTHDYLLNYDLDARIWSFYRALDTKGKDVNTPSYIEYNKDYKYWVDTTSDNETHVFYGKVIEVNNGSIIVEPDQDSNERRSSDKIYVQVTGEYKVGDRVKVTYSGGIMESYPAQVGDAHVELDY